MTTNIVLSSSYVGDIIAAIIIVFGSLLYLAVQLGKRNKTDNNSN